MANLPRTQKRLKQRLSVMIHPDLLDIVTTVATRRGVDPAQIIEEALDAALRFAPRVAALEAVIEQYLQQAVVTDEKLDALAEFIARATRRG